MRLSLDQQMASVLDRLQGSRVEIEASLTRLQETHQQVHTSLKESANGLEQKIAESLGQQLVAARECLQGARLEAESAVARLEELRQTSYADLQKSVTTWEGESASRLESRLAAFLEQHVAPRKVDCRAGALSWKVSSPSSKTLGRVPNRNFNSRLPKYRTESPPS
jgi:hypothetical protein